jgi:hypothetical protein
MLGIKRIQQACFPRVDFELLEDRAAVCIPLSALSGHGGSDMRTRVGGAGDINWLGQEHTLSFCARCAFAGSAEAIGIVSCSSKKGGAVRDGGAL